MYLKSYVNIMITLSIAISLHQNASQVYIMDLINLFQSYHSSKIMYTKECLFVSSL